MESQERYLARKHREIALIEAGVAVPDAGPPPRTASDIVSRKFRAASALQAAETRSDWQLTETHWTSRQDFRIGPFSLAYNYQRADLAIEGPPVYPALEAGWETVWSGYTSCGMAAIAILAAALGQTCPGAVLSAPPDLYPETGELLALYGRQFGFVPVFSRDPDGDLLFLDSGVPGGFTAPDPHVLASCRLLVFDTTCFAANSARIRALLAGARSARLPVALVRSHTKLDSLGVEYGRLGSVVIAAGTDMAGTLAPRLAMATETARRLFGAAALPEHLPPFAAGAAWHMLYRARTARIIRNNRAAARALTGRLRGLARVRCYQHGLFLTLAMPASWDEATAREKAESLSRHLQDAHLPVRHAGSFGFDFVVLDAYPEPQDENWVLRIGFADLPGELTAQVIDGIAAWFAGSTMSRR